MIKTFLPLKKMLRPEKIYNLYFWRPVKGFSIDTRTIKRGQAYIAIAGKYKDGHDYITEAVKKGAAAIIAQRYVKTSRKVPFFVVPDTYESLSVLARFVRDTKNPFVFAVTGSIGKTTTKEMLSFILEDKFKVLKNYKTENNILGVAKTIFSLKDEEILVLELGVNHPGEMKPLAYMSHPDVGVVTFIKPVHLEGFGSLKNIFKEKMLVFSGSGKTKAVLNADDDYLSAFARRGPVLWFGAGANNTARPKVNARFAGGNKKSNVFIINGKWRLILLSPFKDFVYNALAAIAAARLKKMAFERITRRLSRFKKYTALRMQVKERKGVTVINDSYNSNPYAFCRAMDAASAFSGKKIAVIGDMLELGEKSIYYHKKLAPAVLESGFDYCLTIGKYTPYLKKELERLGFENTAHFTDQVKIAGFINEKIKHKPAGEKYVIFIKGSRGLELDKVAEIIKQ